MALFAAVAALAVPAAFAGDSADGAEWLGDSAAPASDGALRSETGDTWLVELGGSAADFRNAAKAAGLKYTERFAFSTLWNGISIKADSSQLTLLRTISGVKAVYPVLTAQLDPQTGGEELDLATATQMTGANLANAAGKTGAGVLVAVMDTGVDYDHPDLGGCFGPACKVSKGYDFVGDAYDANPANATYNPVPAPDAFPDDCNGHGTHVAGIVGANGTVKGVAPGAKIAAYRVFGCEGSTDSDIMIAAMERALADGAHVLNMSIGAAFQTWPQYPTAVAASRLVDRGVVVVASIGNSGANGAYSAGAPGVGDNVIGTASFDNTHVTQFAFAISPDGKLNGYVNATAAPPAPKSGSLPLGRTGTQTSVADACASVTTDIATLPPLTGQAVLIRRGTCGFYNKALAAQRAGAAAVVIYNNAAGAINPTVAPRRAAHGDDHDPGRGDLAGRRQRDRQPPRGEPGDAHLDGPDGDGSQRDREPDLVVLVLRHERRADPEAGHRRSGRQHLVDVPAREGGLRERRRHVDGLAARGGRRRTAPGGEADAGGEPVPRRPAEQRRPEGVVGQPRARTARHDVPAGRRDGRRRRLDHRGDARHAGQALARRERGRAADADADDPEQRLDGGDVHARPRSGPLCGCDTLRRQRVHRVRDRGVQRPDRDRAGGRYGDGERDDHGERRSR